MTIAAPRRRAPKTVWLLCMAACACGGAPPPAREPEIAPSAGGGGDPARESASPAAAGASSAAPPDLLAPSKPAASDSAPADTRDKTAIQRVISDNRAKVRACYEAALAQNPGIEGVLSVGFVINPDGSVKVAEVNWSESDIHIPELDTCAADVVKSLKFPPSSRGLESKVNYPFDFKPARAK